MFPKHLKQHLSYRQASLSPDRTPARNSCINTRIGLPRDSLPQDRRCRHFVLYSRYIYIQIYTNSRFAFSVVTNHILSQLQISHVFSNSSIYLSQVYQNVPALFCCLKCTKSYRTSTSYIHGIYEVDVEMVVDIPRKQSRYLYTFNTNIY